jgi:hypothetical protein
VMKSRRKASVSRTAAVLILATLSAWGAQTGSAQDVSNTELKACTLIGCGPDALAISLTAIDGANPSTLPDLSLDVDGVRVDCRSVDISNEVNGSPCDDQRVRLSIQPKMDCGSDGVCVPAVGKTAVHILVIGTPSRVQASLRGSPAQRVTFTPQYDDRYPNGRDCPPPCRAAHAIWVANHPW